MRYVIILLYTAVPPVDVSSPRARRLIGQTRNGPMRRQCIK